MPVLEPSARSFRLLTQSYVRSLSFAPLVTTETYGSTEHATEITTRSSDESLDDFDDGRQSFHLGMKRMNASNIWTSMRFTESFAEYGDEYQLVPTQLDDNVKLVPDPNLDPTERGTLYYAEDSFYNREEKPQYCLTVGTDIYKKVLAEVSDAQRIPCGLYFCCHGGDGAHTGVSHDDYVDIKMAWALVLIFFGVMLYLSVAVPWPVNDNDDFFE